MIRKAENSDLEKIADIYSRIHDEEEAGRITTGWKREIYPTRKTAEEALDRGDLFVMEDAGIIVACGVINRIQYPEYAKAAWKYEADDSEVMVLHTLVVDPDQSKKGFGKAFVAYYEGYAREHGCPELRIDTNARNERAREMYNRLGYTEVSTVPCDFNGLTHIQLVCLEKRSM